MFDRRTFLAALGALTAGVMVGGCGSPASRNAGDRPLVYTSFYPIQSLTKLIAGDHLEVRSFLPPGQDPHLWEPTPRAIQALAGADLLIANGANMEAWLPQVRENLPDLQVLVLSEYVDLITYKGAAARGEFQYLAKAPLANGGHYRLVFGHTHERSMRIAFFTAAPGTSQSALVARGRQVMDQAGIDVKQHSDAEVQDGQVLAIEMGHESGEVTLQFPSSGEGDWYLVSDRVSQEILSYWVADSDGKEIPTEPVIDGSSTGTDQITFDPHSWMSVVNAKRYCNAIQGTLSAKYPVHDRDFRRSKLDVVRKLTHLQAQYKEKFQKASRREFVVSHNAFSYVARDFGLTQLSLQGLTTDEAPSLYSLISAIRFVRSHNINIVYHELGRMDPGIQTIVEEADVITLPLASMEFVSADDEQFSDGYPGYLEMNLKNLYASMA